MFMMLSCALLLFILVPATSARCVDKYFGTADCIQRCQSKMGYPGMMMGRSAWGTVIDQADASQWSALVYQACGLSSIPSGSKPAIPAGAVGSDPSSSSLSSTSVSITPSSSVSPSVNGTSSTNTATTIVSSNTPISTSITSSRVSTSQFTTPTRTSTVRSPDPTTTPSRPSSHSQSSSSASPKSTPVSSGSSSSSGDSSSQDLSIQAFLAGHNTIRALHGAKSLTWSNSLAASAQEWANGCAFKHSRAGENLAAGAGGGYDIAAGIKSWTDEVKDYDPNKPQPSHFTQVVWKATTQVGCGQQLCNGIFDPSLGKALYIVCHYSPPGNVDDQYSQNVQV